MNKICVFSRAFYPMLGGLERIAQMSATQMSKLGYSVEVVTDALNEDGDDSSFPFHITRTSRFVKRVEAFKRADVVFMLNISLHGMIAAWSAQVPIVILHQSHYKILISRNIVFEQLKRILMRFVVNISCSSFVARSILPAQSIVISNPYNDELFKIPLNPEHDRDFVFCARLVSDKGGDVCVNAFKLVLEEVPDATLTIIGDGPERNPLELLVNELQVDKNVHFTGALDGEELVSELQRHTCMVVSSLWDEPFGIVALEGLACCRVVIVSDRGGLPEAVGNCGLVVEPTAANFAEKMIEIGKAVRTGSPISGQPTDLLRQEFLQEHTAKAVTKKYLDVINRVINGGKSLCDETGPGN